MPCDISSISLYICWMLHCKILYNNKKSPFLIWVIGNVDDYSKGNVVIPLFQKTQGHYPIIPLQKNFSFFIPFSEKHPGDEVDYSSTLSPGRFSLKRPVNEVALFLFGPQNFAKQNLYIYYNFVIHNEYLISQLNCTEQNSSRILVSEQNFEQNNRFLQALPSGRISHFTWAEFIQA